MHWARVAFVVGVLTGCLAAQSEAPSADAPIAEPSAPAFKSETVHIESAPEVVLEGTLSLPAGAGPFPAIVLLTGSGAQDRDCTLGPHKSFVVIAEKLNAAGVAVLRCDDRGVGASTGSFADMTTLDQAADARAQMAFLRGRAEIDAARVGVFGHSEGGVAASVAAAADNQTACLVLMASPGLPGRSVLQTQLRAILEQAGLNAEQIDENTRLQNELFDLIAAKAPEEQIAESIKQLAKQQISAASGQEPSPMQLEMIAKQQVAAFNRDWMRVFMTLDPAEHLAKVTTPTLVLAAERDLQVQPEKNVPPITAALEKAGNTGVTVMRFPDHNHLFQRSATGSLSEYVTLPVAIEAPVAETIATWTAQTLGVQPAAVSAGE